CRLWEGAENAPQTVCSAFPPLPPQGSESSSRSRWRCAPHPPPDLSQAPTGPTTSRHQRARSKRKPSAASAPEALRRPLASVALQSHQLLVPEPERLPALRPVVVQVVGPLNLALDMIEQRLSNTLRNPQRRNVRSPGAPEVVGPDVLQTRQTPELYIRQT